MPLIAPAAPMRLGKAAQECLKHQPLIESLPENNTGRGAMFRRFSWRLYPVSRG